ncbi:FAD-dependent oxidoreductase [Lentzea tibetensis]|uniref:FAD-dependent oxidoreductase n=1 Tax=Lentzea tibetensis TaxID=2591470 RepID=A0A563EN72_9PSEU|nr:BBE domain-containing protein [Lentzea tibetensis]TWP48822.1 FAD-dependent oxidoreductase [Lentzea tibetensis]
MTALSRRGFLAGTAIGGASLVAGTSVATAAAEAARTCAPFGPVTIPVGDPRYLSVQRAHNTRYVGSPDYSKVVGTPAHVVSAVGDAVAAGKRIAARSGGHCMENFTTTDVKALIDLSQLDEVYYDEAKRAFCVEPGATIGRMAETLFKGWGVMIPGTGCAAVGVGGHIPGGGYGFYSRRYGITVDHLYAIEVVTVDAAGTPKLVVATREATDPNRDLWWAHTGGGGGNFGIVTKYWFRSPGATSTDPRKLLPSTGNQRARMVMYSWQGMSEQSFIKLIRNYSNWFEANSAPGNPNTKLWGTLFANHAAAGTIGVLAGVEDTVSGGQAMLDAHFNSIMADVGATPIADFGEVTSWLDPRNWVSDPAGRQKNKTADLRKGYSDAQISTIYRYLNDPGYSNANALVNMTGFGGQINSVASDATAAVHRDSILRVYFTAGGWTGEWEDETHMTWVRNLYRDVYATTGGVPVPNATNGGAFINYADSDLLDPAWNTSGVPWHTLYYRDNYPRLQRIKKRYDPRNVFKHSMSIVPA